MSEEIGTILTNQVDFRVNYDSFNKKYEIYQITTEQKFINNGSRLLDAVFGKEGLNALSFSYDSGRSAFAMFISGSVIIGKINDRLKQECQEDPTLSVKRVYPEDLKKYILMRLMLNSLANFDDEKYIYNNLSGKLYIIHRISTSKKVITTLEIGFDYRSNMTANAVTFTQLDWLLPDKPYYVRGGNNKTLIRIYEPEKAKGKPIYQRKSLPGVKAHIAFLKVWTRKEHEKKLDDKAAYMYQTLNSINELFADCLDEQFHFTELGIRKETIEYDVKLDYSPILREGVNLINGLRNESSPIIQEDFELLRKDLEKYLKVTISDNPHPDPNDDILPDAYNIIMYHNKDYYVSDKKEDPYSRINRADNVVQALTYEDFVSKIKDGEIFDPAYKTILKEMMIKWDIVHSKKITIANWAEKHYEKDWIFAERDEKDGGKTTYFLRIEPTGDFKCYYATPGGFNKLDRECQKLLMAMDEEMDSSYKQGIMDSFGNIMLIGREGRMVMPTEKAALVRVPKGKSDHEEYRRGLYGVNLYNHPQDKNVLLFSAAPQPIDKVDITLQNGVQIYKCKAVQGENVLQELLKTFAVPFVKLNSFTVLPYPFKYVREYMEMERWRIADWEKKRRGLTSFDKH